jgi:hypothetical protein
MLSRMMARVSVPQPRGETSAAAAAALFAADLFLPAALLEDLRFRIARNGQAMPILPLGSGWNF